MKQILIVCALAVFLGTSVWADLMPSFANVPTGWVTDRYQPDSFSDVGSFQGRNDVLGIGISPTQDFTHRPSGYQSTFYNTQGMQHAISGGTGTDIEADLYIDSSWANPDNGNVRTDMWGVMSDVHNSVTDYPIIGFTNYGGTPRYRVWNESIGWVDIGTAVVYDAWTAFAIKYVAGHIDYFINGNDVYTYTEDPTTTGFSAVIMQAYNFGGDPSITGAVATNYNVDWSNSTYNVNESASTPEPSSWLLFGTVVFAVGRSIRKRVC